MNKTETFDMVRLAPTNGLMPAPSDEQVVGKALASINSVLQSTQAQIEATVDKMKDTIRNCEARIASNEEINVVISKDQIVFSLKRSFEIAKDK